MGTGSFPGVKRPGRDADHPPQSKRRSYERVGVIPLLTLWASVICYRENFTFFTLYPTLLSYTTFYPTLLLYTSLYPTILPYTTFYPTFLLYTFLYPTILPYNTLYPTLLPYTSLYPDLLYYIALYPTLLPYTTLYPTLFMLSPDILTTTYLCPFMKNHMSGTIFMMKILTLSFWIIRRKARGGRIV
jgi:hypothetical protein